MPPRGKRKATAASSKAKKAKEEQVVPPEEKTAEPAPTEDGAAAAKEEVAAAADDVNGKAEEAAKDGGVEAKAEKGDEAVAGDKKPEGDGGTEGGAQLAFVLFALLSPNHHDGPFIFYFFHGSLGSIVGRTSVGRCFYVYKSMEFPCTMITS